ncbi:MAG: GNAT family N-acetyltransferase [Propionibacteriaceae bacterium]|nr:GNAT family N-acetyltransferase [Propionibacteriaceae bacterium]
MTDASRTPDSCRLALPTEAERLAAIQRRSWHQQFPPDVAEHLMASVDLASMTQSWTTAIARPPLATMRVLVAIGDGRVVGFAAVGPSAADDAALGAPGLVAALIIAPPAQRKGHGSRLLNAVADTLRADGFTRATWWVRSTDDPLRSFLASAGWAADGAHQSVGTADEAARVRMIRMHTALA